MYGAYMQLRHLGRRLGRRGGLGATLQTPNGTVSWAAPSLFGAPFTLARPGGGEGRAWGEKGEALSGGKSARRATARRRTPRTRALPQPSTR
eukprot:scaffold11962_cov52-Phaeocystis_antarctica.AAC.4